MSRIDLSDCTFIIPIGLDSPDREENAFITLSYLCKHIDTNIIVYGTSPKVYNLLTTVKNCCNSIVYIHGKQSSTFHRTKYINRMLEVVETPITVNYDCDILLQPESYLKARNAVLSGIDLHYPYFFGISQWQVNYQGRDKIKQSLSLDYLTDGDYQVERGECGHCQFFRTEAYRAGGRENERFISYAPEDQERYYRFKKMGFNVQHGTDYVIHLEHTRGVNSSNDNPYMERNNQLWAYIQRLSTEELKAYYENNK